jgi:tetratricopeptide (TPR) repeat protein
MSLNPVSLSSIDPPIHSLPNDMLHVIFSELDFQSIKKVGSVCKLWSRFRPWLVQFEINFRYTQLASHVSCLYTHLKSELPDTILEQIGHPKISTLHQMHLFEAKIQELFAKQLFSATQAVLESYTYLLQQTEAHPFFASILGLRMIYVELSDSHTNNAPSHNALIRELALTGHCQEALRIAWKRYGCQIPNVIDAPYTFFYSLTLQNIVKGLIDQGDLEKACKMALSIPENSVKGVALLIIVNALIKKEHLEEALRVIHRFPTFEAKNQALYLLCEAWSDAGNELRTLKMISYMEEDSPCREEALLRLPDCEELLDLGEDSCILI